MDWNSRVQNGKENQKAKCSDEGKERGCVFDSEAHQTKTVVSVVIMQKKKS